MSIWYLFNLLHWFSVKFNSDSFPQWPVTVIPPWVAPCAGPSPAVAPLWCKRLFVLSYPIASLSYTLGLLLQLHLNFPGLIIHKLFGSQLLYTRSKASIRIIFPFFFFFIQGTKKNKTCSAQENVEINFFFFFFSALTITATSWVTAETMVPCCLRAMNHRSDCRGHLLAKDFVPQTHFSHNSNSPVTRKKIAASLRPRQQSGKHTYNLQKGPRA